MILADDLPPTPDAPVTNFVTPPTSDAFLTQPWATLFAGVAAIIAAAIAFWVAYLTRRQLEKHWQTSNRQERFTTAATQLADDNPAVRIAGVAALEALTNDWIATPQHKHRHEKKHPDHLTTGLRHPQAQACVNVLCAYLRLPETSRDDSSLTHETITRNHVDGSTREQTHHYKPDDREVRNTILRTITTHLHPEHTHPWTHLDYDFTAAHLHDADFTDCQFHGATTSFDGAKFRGEKTSFHGSRFCGGATSFYKTQFHGIYTTFYDAQFHGDVTSFTQAQFRSEEATVFDHVQCYGEATSFYLAQFRSAMTSFDGAKFHSDEAIFIGAEFRGEKTSFLRAEFHCGHTEFHEARFYGRFTSFDGAEFRSAMTSFDGAEFRSAQVSFDAARFRGQRELIFGKAKFRQDQPSFDGAEFGVEDFG
ncbi:hypothetical protein [Gordonia sp. N1V]|uniref:pentapeptide repeat-containing protein n=1 Tax=Gordonia sp. N1V TaxID=3034163 RepID=UPI0023E34E31|nr:hypothetical protein [Gordonia sp. N1V]MDF3284983.1 hypothetical protein [Gordonia sp. N1V]